MSTQPTWAEGVAKLYKEVVNPLSPWREREGPAAKQWEGGGGGEFRPRPLTPLAKLGTLSLRGRGLFLQNVQRGDGHRFGGGRDHRVGVGRPQ